MRICCSGWFVTNIVRTVLAGGDSNLLNIVHTSSFANIWRLEEFHNAIQVHYSSIFKMIQGSIHIFWSNRLKRHDTMREQKKKLFKHAHRILSFNIIHPQTYLFHLTKKILSISLYLIHFRLRKHTKLHFFLCLHLLQANQLIEVSFNTWTRRIKVITIMNNERQFFTDPF